MDIFPKNGAVEMSEEDRLDALAMRIAFLRRRGVTSIMIARECGINPVSLSQMLTGGRRVPGRLESVERVVGRLVRRYTKKRESDESNSRPETVGVGEAPNEVR